MKRKTAFMLSALLMASSVTGCGGKSSSAPDTSGAPAVNTTENQEVVSGSDTEEASEEATEPPIEHISPVETVTASQGVQIAADQVIGRAEGSNTVKFPLSSFIEEGDKISSFTFVISSDNVDIGTFKGGCGISVGKDCPAATNDYWYQSGDFTAPTQGTYGEIRWDVPAELVDYIPEGGEVLFGYYWGNPESIHLDGIICNFTRTREIPVDGTVTQEISQSVNYTAENNTVSVPVAGFLPENAVPQAVSVKFTAPEPFGRFKGAFSYESSAGRFQAPDTAVTTGEDTIELTWFVPDNAKILSAADGIISFGYWWGDQPEAVAESITVKYSSEDGSSVPSLPQIPAADNSVPRGGEDFRSAKDIVDDIKVGWNLGNTLDSYDTDKTGIDTETGWGNPKTTEEMIQGVKDAGFNAIRIPVTWGEHMDGDVIQSEWLDRVQEVVDYAYNKDMYVILNMHHDDYIWFVPNDSKFEECNNKLMNIWTQISVRFRDYGDRLLFEGMNEPRTIDSPNEWMGGTAAERTVVNRYAHNFIYTVRSTGGNNSARTLIMTSYGASAEEVAVKDVIMPDDGNVILTLHYYAPWKFTNGQSTTFGSADKAELSARFAALRSRFVDAGVPVIIGEFGSIAAADDATRAEYYKSYISSAKANGIRCFIWDNGVLSGKDSYGIYDRTALTWNDTILNAVMEGAES